MSNRYKLFSLARTYGGRVDPSDTTNIKTIILYLKRKSEQSHEWSENKFAVIIITSPRLNIAIDRKRLINYSKISAVQRWRFF